MAGPSLMKWIIITFCLTPCIQLQGQSLDDLALDKEVIVFIRKEFKSLKNFNLGIKVPKEENQWYLDSLSYSPWFVGDFNKDGLSDLFLTGMERKKFTSYLILARENETNQIVATPKKEKKPETKKAEKEKKKKKEEEDPEDEFTNDMAEEEVEEDLENESTEMETKEEEFTSSEENFTQPSISYELMEVSPVSIKGTLIIPFVEETLTDLLIIVKQFATEQKVTMHNGVEIRKPKVFNEYFQMGFIRKDTFCYKYGGIIEYNPKPSTNTIRYIQLHYYCQFGGCPDYKMKVDSKAMMILQNIRNTNEEIGNYKATCEKESFDELMGLTNYVKYAKNDLKFGESSSDEVITLQVVFSDGTSRKIIDYSLGGTKGLSRIYDLLYDIKARTSWQ